MKAVSEMGWPELITVLLIIFFARTLLFAGGSSIWITFTQWPRKYLIDRQINRKFALWREIAWAAVILMFDAVMVTLAITSGWLVLVLDEIGPRYIATFFGMFVWAEVYFYYSHRLLHHPKLYWIHRHHHINRPTTPWTSLAFSISERVVLLGGILFLPAVVSQWIPFSQGGYSLYFLLNYILNVYGHLNVEIVPYSWARVLFGRVMNTTTYHSLHHIRYNGHYGLYTQFLDRWHGTNFKDVWELHKQNRG